MVYMGFPELQNFQYLMLVPLLHIPLTVLYQGQAVGPDSQVLYLWGGWGTLTALKPVIFLRTLLTCSDCAAGCCSLGLHWTGLLLWPLFGSLFLVLGSSSWISLFCGSCLHSRGALQGGCTFGAPFAMLHQKNLTWKIRSFILDID